MQPVRVRFAPSPTGNVHIGNIRVAIFNWLFARHHGGAFLLRVEDTDRERSTPEAIDNMLGAMKWLGLNADEEPIYQSASRTQHDATAAKLIAAGYASRAGNAADATPTVLHLDAKLLDESFVTAPRDAATIVIKAAELRATNRSILMVATSSKGQTFITPVNWDALDSLAVEGESGARQDGIALREKVATAFAAAAEPVDLHGLAGEKIIALHFKRRYVFFTDAVMGRLEKPLDSLRDLVIVRSDGSPVFHLANVVDDVAMGITHILRGNDHVENTYRHLFLYHALGATPPTYAHFPMIVNAKGKPYSKRDGDAYIGDFREKGYLSACLFNFLALCGWSPGGDREIMSREELTRAFSPERALTAPAQMNLEKLEWMNGQYVMQMPLAELTELIQAELATAGLSESAMATDEAWLARLVSLQRERMKTVRDFVANTHYFFAETIERQEKAVNKCLRKKEGAGLRVLGALLPLLQAHDEWTESALAATLESFMAAQGLKLGDVAQPLRVAVTGGTVSPGIVETLFLLGQTRTLKRIEETLATVV